MKKRQFLKLSGLAALVGLGGTGTATAVARSRNPYYTGPASGNFDGTRFFNPDGSAPKGLSDLLRWQFGGGKTAWPDMAQSPFPQTRPDLQVEGSALRVTMVGHATLLIQTAGQNILVDPVWSERASPVAFAGPKRVNAPGIAFDALPPIDVVLVSHNHYDHLDLDTLSQLRQRHNPLVITPLGNDSIIRQRSSDMRNETGNWGDTVRFRDLTFSLEPCHHWSARGMNDRSMALWAAFVIDGPAGKILHVGDTGFDQGRPYRNARDRHGPIKLAILPVGAYEPRWFMKDQHQNPGEAVEGFMLSGADHALGHHWGTFRLTNEGMDAPREMLVEALAQRGIAADRFHPLQPGEVWNLREDA